jgi:hypothetical protein
VKADSTHESHGLTREAPGKGAVKE